MKSKKRGFTLIELLVVIAIIALLLSIVTPALRKAKQYSRRVVCSSNLHQWGVVLSSYTNDNDNTLVGTSNSFAEEVYPYPVVAWVDRDSSPTADQELNAEAMSPYMPGINFETHVVSDIWTCPSNKDGIEVIVSQWETEGELNLQYSYFARSDVWPDERMTQSGSITKKYLSSSKILMNDTVFRWGGSGSWFYNHGKNGSSFAHETNMYGTPEQFSGSNELFGDGRVDWKDKSNFDPERMEALSPDIPMVLGWTSGTAFFY